MELKFETLAPYQTFLLAKLGPGNKPEQIVSQIVSDLQCVLKLASGDRTLQALGKIHRKGKLEIGGFSYRVRKLAPEFRDGETMNVEHHLALVFRLGSAVAIHLSESQRYTSLLRDLKKTTLAALGKLEPYSPQLLEAVFIKGPVTALWLAGIHRRTAMKPDTKSLNGTNLRDSLDPLLDQTYHATAGRSQADIGESARRVGTSFHNSRIWVSNSRCWQDCIDVASSLLAHLSSTNSGNGDPLPFLARPSELAEIGPAYEMAIMPPELLLDSPTLADPERLQELESWHDKTSFVIDTNNGNEIHAAVQYGDEVLGKARFRLESQSQGRVAVVTHSQSSDPRLKQLLRHCEADQWLRIWFSSGDVLGNDRIFKTQVQDYPFANFAWERFPGCTVTREKPGSLAAIGTQDSLFCWTIKHWYPQTGDGWLLCDDGAMEVADFIHLDNGVLTLIHEKAARSTAPNRGLSVASFEVVIAQALKGLRNLHHIHLREGLAQGLQKKIASSAWYRGKPAKREQFLAELAALGSNYQRRVVVVQPHLTDIALENARKAVTNGPESMRYKQLMNFLNTAQASARSLGAELLVIGQELGREKNMPASLERAARIHHSRKIA